ncbi:permease (plasmid) [Gemmatirosa kalamazoonensis]|uniref:Permease n=2 Tax=Gemmatirosa kalamazoonensis TaxID=861299 RepID=W0RT30_9BACT|nr:permease [Gemmatirosa kalamazoonensis]
MMSLGKDVRLAVRALARSRGFTVVAALSLALGIAACTLIFSALDTLILRALPFEALDRLVGISETTRDCPSCSSSVGDYAVLRRDARALRGVATTVPWSGTLAGRDGAERVEGRRVTPGFFALLGARPALGRTFDGDSLAPPPLRSVVLGDRLWRTRFGGDSTIVGRTITLNGLAYTVTGVMPPRFAFGGVDDLWIPLWFSPGQERDHLSHGYLLAARLAPGATRARLQTELDGISKRIAATYPEQNLGMRLRARPLADALVGDIRRYFVPLLAGVGFVLLIVCANVANLTLARASERRREIALRAALGARRWRVARQLLVESALLAAAGVVLGLGVAAVCVPVLRGGVPAHLRQSLPGWDALALDARAAGFSVAVGVACVLLFGVVPALRSSRPDLSAALSEGSRGSTSADGGSLRRALVVAQLALALSLLAGGALMTRSLAKLVVADTGFRAERALTMALQVPARKYAGADAARRFVERTRAQIAALPGVAAVAGTWNLPLSGERNFTQYDLAGRAPTPLAEQPSATDAWVTPGYFAALGIALRQGRDFTPQDDSTAPRVVLVSESFARRAWPAGDAIGRGVITNGTTYAVVGVVADVRQDGVEIAATPAIYRDIEQTSGGIPTALVVRARAEPTALTASIRRALSAIDPDAAIADVRTMPQVVGDYLAPWRLLAALLGAFAGAALGIAAVGIYGVMAYAVAQRTHEIGIRMALGAERARVMTMVLRQAMALVAAGVAFGALGALGTARALSFLLYGVGAGDPLALGAVVALLAVVALVAAWVPARRAARVDPVVALRAP